jgi:hypothetical protein
MAIILTQFWISAILPLLNAGFNTPVCDLQFRFVFPLISAHSVLSSPKIQHFHILCTPSCLYFPQYLRTAELYEKVFTDLWCSAVEVCCTTDLCCSAVEVCCTTDLCCSAVEVCCTTAVFGLWCITSYHSFERWILQAEMVTINWNWHNLYSFPPQFPVSSCCGCDMCNVASVSCGW